jgi:hypothetical protein
MGRLLLLAALASSAVLGSQIVAQTEAPEVIATYILPETRIGEFENGLTPDSVANDRGFLLGGIGSDLWHGATDAPDEFWMITDRGPNGQIKVDDKNRRTFPIPDFDPVILHVRAADDTITILDAHLITTQSGAPVTGLSNFEGYDELPYDYTAQTPLTYNQNGLDSEGLVRTSAGDFWVADEYSPSILHLDATGKVIKRYVPEGLTFDAADYEVAGALPAIYNTRKINRGFEGLALSADETTLYAILQSPLLNPDAATGNASRNTRIIVFDIASETVTAEYVYQFDDAVEFGGADMTPAEMKLSAAVAVNPTTLLIDERTDWAAKLYLVDLSAATNILGSAWNDPATTPSLEASDDLAAAGVTPLPKTLVLDVTPLIAGIGKLEGLAILDASTIVLANDNDFNIGDFDADGNNIPEGVQSQLLTIKLPTPLPLP